MVSLGLYNTRPASDSSSVVRDNDEPLDAPVDEVDEADDMFSTDLSDCDSLDLAAGGAMPRPKASARPLTLE